MNRALVSLLEKEGEGALVQKIRCKQIKKELIYAHVPTFVKRVWSRIKKN